MIGDPLQSILRHYPVGTATIEPTGKGLVNTTWRVSTAEGQEYILQRVNRIFPPAINEDIEAVTSHIAGKGLPTPRLVPTRSGDLYVEEGDECWRLMDRIEGTTYTCLQQPRHATSAGALLARFHAAVADLDHRFSNPRPGIHDTPRHIGRLREALGTCAEHSRFETIEPIAHAILELGAGLSPPPALPDRTVHGDPKISNILFDLSGEAICLVDLDTLGRMPLPLELGDALRSWCNPTGEDVRETEFSMEFFEAALEGYFRDAPQWISAEEIESIVPALLRISVELAARFCTDALREDYFAWDPKRFTSHSEHSEVRAAGQLALASAVRGRSGELTAIIARYTTR